MHRLQTHGADAGFEQVGEVGATQTCVGEVQVLELCVLPDVHTHGREAVGVFYSILLGLTVLEQLVEGEVQALYLVWGG